MLLEKSARVLKTCVNCCSVAVGKCREGAVKTPDIGGSNDAEKCRQGSVKPPGMVAQMLLGNSAKSQLILASAAVN